MDEKGTAQYLGVFEAARTHIIENCPVDMGYALSVMDD
jgi:hypothetical protein